MKTFVGILIALLSVPFLPVGFLAFVMWNGTVSGWQHAIACLTHFIHGK